MPPESSTDDYDLPNYDSAVANADHQLQPEHMTPWGPFHDQSQATTQYNVTSPSTHGNMERKIALLHKHGAAPLNGSKVSMEPDTISESNGSASMNPIHNNKRTSTSSAHSEESNFHKNSSAAEQRILDLHVELIRAQVTRAVGREMHQAIGNQAGPIKAKNSELAHQMNLEKRQAMVKALVTKQIYKMRMLDVREKDLSYLIEELAKPPLTKLSIPTIATPNQKSDYFVKRAPVDAVSDLAFVNDWLVKDITKHPHMWDREGCEGVCDKLSWLQREITRAETAVKKKASERTVLKDQGK
ncbi:Uu.00g088160.m01.CDS01 [Anthostomella pinea]|uniref:Uu.00g088160.m01.CDS01 n=1 Tax=Anthostomella pinea TaxID=933095 RepID=A0AAI8VNM5_9PEZI|nr:Uu.00g088160.m01.CDS01 [Anthostomella pinea]